METGRPMIPFKEALEKILKNISVLSHFEEVALENCSSRVLAESVYADRDIPPFNRAAVDGFAIKSSDREKLLKLIETVPAGAKAEHVVKEGTCIRIMTGAPVPAGTEQIVMVEYSTESNGFIKFEIPQKDINTANFALQGEDMKKGELALSAGTFITPGIISTLASLGKFNVSVVKKPKIGIIVTGDEVVEPWVTPENEHIRNSNGWQLIAQINRAGCTPVYKGIVADHLEKTKAIIEETASECDIVLMTGGVSMGDYDYGGKALLESGFDIKFDSVAVKPGKPLTLAVREKSGKNEVVIGLPGNPYSVFVMFEVAVRPAIEKMSGANRDFNKKAILNGDFNRRRVDREEWIPAKIEIDGSVTPLKHNGSGHFHILSVADAVFKIERGENSLKKGEIVSVRQI
ncbi:MAG: molybdopterin molybdotransferase MoeA [bacterium]